MTSFIHGREEFLKAVETTQKLFANQSAPAESLSVQDLESLEGVITHEFALEKLKSGIDVVSFLAETSIFPSKGEARKTLQNGGVSINRKKVTETSMTVDEGLLLHEQYILVQKGKRNYYLVRAV